MPGDFSEQAKFDREKGLTPVRLTFLAENETTELFRNWPEIRIPIDYKTEIDIDAGGKYNPELFETGDSPIMLDDLEENTLSETESDGVPDYSDGPLLEF